MPLYALDRRMPEDDLSTLEDNSSRLGRYKKVRDSFCAARRKALRGSWALRP